MHEERDNEQAVEVRGAWNSKRAAAREYADTSDRTRSTSASRQGRSSIVWVASVIQGSQNAVLTSNQIKPVVVRDQEICDAEKKIEQRRECPREKCLRPLFQVPRKSSQVLVSLLVSRGCRDFRHQNSKRATSRPHVIFTHLHAPSPRIVTSSPCSNVC